MSSLLIFWISVAIGFLIIEMITVTFYGLAISLAGFITALYVYLEGWVEVTITQGVIFATVSFFASSFLPRYLTSQVEEKAQWLDLYLGEKRKVKKVWEDFKVILDWVDYFVDIDGVKVGDKVKLTSRKGSIFRGEIII